MSDSREHPFPTALAEHGATVAIESGIMALGTLATILMTGNDHVPYGVIGAFALTEMVVTFRSAPMMTGELLVLIGMNYLLLSRSFAGGDGSAE